MKINLLQILKELPLKNYADYGLAIGFDDIFSHLELYYNIDNRNLISVWLQELADDHLIKLHKLEDLIVAVSVL